MRNDVVRLNCGLSIPAIGFGTYSVPNHGEITEAAIKTAIQVGYRHFDMAKIYDSERAVGNALGEAMAEGMVKRDQLFVTTKLWSSDHHDPVSALQHSLKILGLEYADMYLMHWPVKLKPWACYAVPNEEDFEELDLKATWVGMEKCLDLGLCRCIGVSNFSSKKIQHFLDFASVPPAVNQVEMHPMWRQSKLRRVCADHKIHISAHSPLGAPGSGWGSTAVLDNPSILSTARKHGATPAQVALKWGLSMGASVIVKSFNEYRMRENMGAFDVNLGDKDLLEVEKAVEMKIMRGEFLVNDTTSPYRTLQDLWDDEI